SHTQSGVYPVTFTVSDGTAEDAEEIAIAVRDMNRAPVFSCACTQSIETHILHVMMMTAADPDCDSLRYWAHNCPDGALFTGNVFSWIPGTDRIGTWEVTFFVTDGVDSTGVTVSFTVIPNDNESEYSPQVIDVDQDSVIELDLDDYISSEINISQIFCISCSGNDVAYEYNSVLNTLSIMPTIGLFEIEHFQITLIDDQGYTFELNPIEVVNISKQVSFFEYDLPDTCIFEHDTLRLHYTDLSALLYDDWKIGTDFEWGICSKHDMFTIECDCEGIRLFLSDKWSGTDTLAVYVQNAYCSDTTRFALTVSPEYVPPENFSILISDIKRVPAGIQFTWTRGVSYNEDDVVRYTFGLVSTECVPDTLVMVKNIPDTVYVLETNVFNKSGSPKQYSVILYAENNYGLRTWADNLETITLHPQEDLQTETHNMTPAAFQLFQNYPNPFNPVTTITYEIPKTSRVSIRIYNLLGQHIKTLVDTEQAAGQYIISWDGTNDNGAQVSSGVYIYNMTAQNHFNISRRMTVNR
ncbi:FlgD immunoglobulin-like domain containing protein, partial [candidate division KSB1 bacterium]